MKSRSVTRCCNIVDILDGCGFPNILKPRLNYMQNHPSTHILGSWTEQVMPRPYMQSERVLPSHLAARACMDALLGHNSVGSAPTELQLKEPWLRRRSPIVSLRARLAVIASPAHHKGRGDVALKSICLPRLHRSSMTLRRSSSSCSSFVELEGSPDRNPGDSHSTNDCTSGKLNS